MKKTIVQIDGGIGRCICATPALVNLSKKVGHKLTLITPWKDVFINAPFVEKMYRPDNDYLFDDVISKGKFYYPEPYHSDLYYTQKHHLVQSFNHLLNGIEKFEAPQLFLSYPEVKKGLDFCNQLREQNKTKLIIGIQFYGAGAVFDGTGIYDPTNRSLSPEVQKLILELDATFINLSHISINHPKVYNQQFSMREIFQIVYSCDYIITIDSIISHVGRAFNRTGLLFLGPTYKENVGYDTYKIIQRKNYPKGYSCNRLNGGWEDNEQAMDFDTKELEEIKKTLKEVIING